MKMNQDDRLIDDILFEREAIELLKAKMSEMSEEMPDVDLVCSLAWIARSSYSSEAHLSLGFYTRERLEPWMIESIDGLEIVLVFDEKFRESVKGRTIRLEGERFVFKQ